MKRIIYLAIISIILSGCYSTKQVTLVEDYKHASMGLNKEEIITHFGQPARIISQENGEVLIYEQFIGKEKTIENRQYLEFYLNENGICKNVNTNYTRDVKYRDDKKTNWAVWGSIAGTVGLSAVIIPTIFCTSIISRK